ncbi:hypothetical protein BB561_001465 [Smittium simulii]|uniref:Uncharacterized protein n=1 Tax=Smittium simulii TaxID=133385 RepID=A0A2T9YUK1_9FUNG|nr:hypothetical protein BB561_001465 [Smittium simulii]
MPQSSGTESTSEHSIIVNTSGEQEGRASRDFRGVSSLEARCGGAVDNTAGKGGKRWMALRADFKRNFSNYVLELSVASHSVIVGFALGLLNKKETVTLAIALSFHQFFEGVSIGDRLVIMYEPNHSILMMFLGSLVYMVSTPVGQFVGILMHTSFPPRSPLGLLCLGILEAVCSGLLFYSTIFNLIIVEFGSTAFLSSSRSFKIKCLLSMYFGFVAMSIVAKWA